MAIFKVKKIGGGILGKERYEIQEPSKTVKGAKLMLTVENLDAQIVQAQARLDKLKLIKSEIAKVAK